MRDRGDGTGVRDFEITFCDCCPGPEPLEEDEPAAEGEKKEDEPKTEGEQKEDEPKAEGCEKEDEHKAEGDAKEDKAKASSLTEMD